ncbi:Hypothetical_protein [Hexamita inflata]|uniref:Hypothetical_protein n=1 Tax=Hexamita inflata TaxID=28002 RepID=A0AA86PU78_9EUKA|nr:Hypothetical protein HINF_LOCUS28687 [Hexamita inflata]
MQPTQVPSFQFGAKAANFGIGQNQLQPKQFENPKVTLTEQKPVERFGLVEQKPAFNFDFAQYKQPKQFENNPQVILTEQILQKPVERFGQVKTEQNVTSSKCNSSTDNNQNTEYSLSEYNVSFSNMDDKVSEQYILPHIFIRQVTLLLKTKLQSPIYFDFSLFQCQLFNNENVTIYLFGKALRSTINNMSIVKIKSLKTSFKKASIDQLDIKHPKALFTIYKPEFKLQKCTTSLQIALEQLSVSDILYIQIPLNDCISPFSEQSSYQSLQRTFKTTIVCADSESVTLLIARNKLSDTMQIQLMNNINEKCIKIFVSFCESTISKINIQYIQTV